MTALLRKLIIKFKKDSDFCNLKNSSAMTIVETLVVLAIVTALLGLSAYALNRFYRNSLLDTATAEALSDLKTLQNYASNNYVPDNPNGIANWKSPFIYEFSLNNLIFSNTSAYKSIAFPFDQVNNTANKSLSNNLEQTRTLDKAVNLKYYGSVAGDTFIDFIGVENRIQINGNCVPTHLCLRIGLADSATEYRLIYINCTQKIIKELDIADEAQCD